jgi:hypothetical protein
MMRAATAQPSRVSRVAMMPPTAAPARAAVAAGSPLAAADSRAAVDARIGALMRARAAELSRAPGTNRTAAVSRKSRAWRR